MVQFQDNFSIVRYKDSDFVKEQVFNAVVEWCKKHSAYAGEMICQSDTTIIEAPDLMATIVDDIIKFDVEWKD